METSSVRFRTFFQGGLTSLHIAARDGYVEIVTILLEGGANPNIKAMVGKRQHVKYLSVK